MQLVAAAAAAVVTMATDRRELVETDRWRAEAAVRSSMPLEYSDSAYVPEKYGENHVSTLSTAAMIITRAGGPLTPG